jgi:NAD dependent epimerase/dehydratase
MQILVTGAGGFIGSHVTELLLGAGHSVRALVHYNGAGSWQNLADLADQHRDQLDVRLGDVTDAFFVRDLVAGCDVVLHLAALIGIPYSYIAPASYVATNIGGTLNVLEACKLANISRVVVTSTSEVYGTARTTPMEESHPLQGQSPYSASKIGADKLAESYYLSFNTPVVTLRPFNTYGPRQSSRAVIPTVITQALSGTKFIKLGNLKPLRDLTFVHDTARAFLLAATIPGIEGQTIHFGHGAAHSVAKIAELCLAAAGSKAKIIIESERKRPDNSEVELLLCNPAKAKRLLGWQPEVSLPDGIARTVEYLRNRPAIVNASKGYHV